ncbi:hypothetical protein LT330_006928 [Penicillium expansum]|nr:hypothetical protein LT330_006928 [Penicillium expansum]
MKCKGSEHTNPSLPYASYSRNTSASVVALENRAIKNYLDVTIPQTADQLVLHMDPILCDINAKNHLEPQVIIRIKNGTWVNLLLQFGKMPNSPVTKAPHMMHKHSNKSFVLGVGPGIFNWSSAEEAYVRSLGFSQLHSP